MAKTKQGGMRAITVTLFVKKDDADELTQSLKDFYSFHEVPIPHCHIEARKLTKEEYAKVEPELDELYGEGAFELGKGLG